MRRRLIRSMLWVSYRVILCTYTQTMEKPHCCPLLDSVRLVSLVVVDRTQAQVWATSNLAVVRVFSTDEEASQLREDWFLGQLPVDCFHHTNLMLVGHQASLEASCLTRRVPIMCFVLSLRSGPFLANSPVACSGGCPEIPIPPQGKSLWLREQVALCSHAGHEGVSGTLALYAGSCSSSPFRYYLHLPLLLTISTSEESIW